MDEFTAYVKDEVFRRFGINRKKNWSYYVFPFGFVVLVLFLVVAVIVKNADFWKAITFVAGIYALFQWKLVREEISFDKYFDRLEGANSQGGVFHYSKNVVPHLTVPYDHKEALYVYFELDMLDYIVGKYKNGYMDVMDAFRGLVTYFSRCESEKFREMTLELVTRRSCNPELVPIVQKIIGCFNSNPLYLKALLEKYNKFKRNVE